MRSTSTGIPHGAGHAEAFSIKPQLIPAPAFPFSTNEPFSQTIISIISSMKFTVSSLLVILAATAAALPADADAEDANNPRVPQVKNMDLSGNSDVSGMACGDKG
jgi:hypothetical protein